MRTIWGGESFEELLNGPSCYISEPGPLHTPAKTFSIGRDSDHRIVLSTVSEAPTPAMPRSVTQKPASQPQSEVVIEGPFGTAKLQGVIPFNHLRSENYVQKTVRHEVTSFVHAIESSPDDPAEVGFMLEWINNYELDGQPPYRGKSKGTRVATLTLPGRDGPVHLESGETITGMPCCFRILLGGWEIFFGELIGRDKASSKNEGFILYQGNAPEDLRRRFRECLSFAVGRPIIYRGYSLYSKDSRALGFRAITGYNSDHAKYSYVGLPPAPLFSGQYMIVDEAASTRLLEGLFNHYEELDFLHVSWLYWHALCSAIHSQPVQIGAAIEALRAAFQKRHPKAYSTSILDSDHQKALQADFVAMVDAMQVGESEKAELKRKASTLNNPSQKLMNERFFAALDLAMGPEELNAWNRRNDAAHGNSTEDYAGLIADVKLLRNIFCRIVLKMSGGSGTYIDFFTHGFPIRSLSEPVSTPQHQGFTRRM